MQRDAQAAVGLDTSDIARVVAALAGGGLHLMKADGSFEECVGYGLTTLGLQHKNSVASTVNGPIEALPPTRDLYVGFVHPPARAS